MKIETLIRFIFLCALLLALVTGSCFLFSCNSAKQVAKKETRYDSTAIKEVQRLTRLMSELKEQHAKELYELSTTGIYFDTVYLPGDIIRTPAKIIIDKDGKIQAEGQLVKVLLTNQRYSKEISLLNKTVDSLNQAIEKNKTDVKTKEVIKEKKVERKVYPLWLFIVCLLIGFIAENKLKVIEKLKRLISLIKF